MSMPRQTMCLCLAAVLTTAGAASAQPTKEGREREEPRDGLIARVTHLMPPAFAAELNLTAEQQKQVQQMEQEFKQARRALLAKAVMAVASIVEGMESEADASETAPVLAIAHEITGALLEMRHTRITFEKRMLALLSPEQREEFAELKSQRPRERRTAARGQYDFKNAEAGPMFILAPEVQQKLGLDNEQKKRLVDLRQELNEKLRGILTQEQSRQYEQWMESRRDRRGSDDRDEPRERRKQD